MELCSSGFVSGRVSLALKPTGPRYSWLDFISVIIQPVSKYESLSVHLVGALVIKQGDSWASPQCVIHSPFF